MTKRMALIGLVFVILLSSAGNVKAFVPSMGDKAPALDPGDTISPAGVETSNVTKYTWSPVGGATKYQVKVKKGSKTVFDFEVTDSYCGTTCWGWPAGILGNKDYKWKVRGYDAGWLSRSDWQKFTVNASGGFKSSFNKNAKGWTSLNGNWKIAKGKYVTKGQEGFFATSSHSNASSDFTYEVKLRRAWDKECTETPFSAIYVRGIPSPLAAPYKDWDNGMRFAYTDTGFVSEGELTDGELTTLVSRGSAHVNKRGWNTLLVVAKGKTYWFYINGNLYDVVEDGSHASGVVGVGFYQESGCSDKLKIDWVKLSENTPF